MNGLDFDDLQPIEIAFPIQGKPYVLREASGDAVTKHRSVMLRALKMGANGRPVGIDASAADAEALLVSLCLYDADEQGHLRLDKNGNPDGRYMVSIPRVKAWPARVQKALFNKIREISDMDESKDSPERRVMLAALAREDFPLPVEQLRQWAADRAEEDPETFQALVELLAPPDMASISLEERVKNGRRATTDGSV
jgi:hypothetical protein